MSKGSKSFVFVCFLGSIAVIVGVFWWIFKTSEEEQSVKSDENSIVQIENKDDVSEGAERTSEKAFDAQKLQQVVEGWATNSPSASVVLADKNGELLASINKDTPFFSASIYKLFVAYEGYKQIDSGISRSDEQYQGSRTREQCLDAMIRESDSPCGEKMWIELGKKQLTDTLQQTGIVNTDMSALRTTAEDVGLLLNRISSGDGLSEESQKKFLDSMYEQESRYRRGLPSGFSDKLLVYNKVGWNEQLEWHDAAVVELPDGRRIVMVVLTSGVGTKKIIELAQLLEPVLLQ